MNALKPYERAEYPWCERCNKYVDVIGTETPVIACHTPRGSWYEHTGEVIVTVRCHGETWQMSNWRGRPA